MNVWKKTARREKREREKEGRTRKKKKLSPKNSTMWKRKGEEFNVFTPRKEEGQSLAKEKILWYNPK